MLFQEVTSHTYLNREVSLLAQWVLADGYDVSVLQQLFGARTNLP